LHALRLHWYVNCFVLRVWLTNSGSRLMVNTTWLVDM
jgi:hypothetical protein